MASCDAYVSLHRSEGFGLTIAEAMAHGKPVIATDYSGNLDFMSEDNSYLVPASKVKIPPGCNPYPTGAFWAEPDVEAAALLMQELVLNTDKVAEKARRGQEDIERYHSPFARSSFIRSRIAEISRQLDEGVLRPLTTLPPRTQVEIRANAESPGVGFVRTVVQTEVEAIDQVVARLTEGPDLKNPARLGRPGLWLRQLVFRLLRNYHLYQYEVGHTLVQALRENRNHIDAIARRLDDLEKRVDAIAATPADLNVPDDRE